MNQYLHHIGDWRSATAKLTRVQRDIYSDLIETYYDKERPLTADFDLLAEDHGCRTPEEKEALAYVLKRYFWADGDFWRHERCDEEIAHFHHKIDVAVRAGKASGSARSQRKMNAKATDVPLGAEGHEKSVAPANPNIPEGVVGEAPSEPKSPKTNGSRTDVQRKGNARSTQPQPPDDPMTHISTPSGVERESTRAGALVPPPSIPPPTAEDDKPRRPSRKCPKDFEVTPLMAQWAMQELGLPDLVIKRETDKLRDHTFSRAITDWVGAWRNWMRKASEYGNHRAHVKGGIGAVLERKQQTDSFMAAAKGDRHGTRGEGFIDVESRTVGDGEEPPVGPAD